MSKRKPGASPKHVRPWKAAVKNLRRTAAESRQKAYDTLTPQQKLEKLDKGHFRALKQRSRLEKECENHESPRRVSETSSGRSNKVRK